jgi:hypothetical protein
MRKKESPVRLGVENAKHMLLKYSETKKWKEEFVCII